MADHEIQIDRSYLPAPSIRDSLLEQLQDCSAALASAPNDEWKKSLVSSCSDAIQGILRIRQFLWRVADKRATKQAALEGFLASRYEQIASEQRSLGNDANTTKAEQCNARARATKDADAQLLASIKDKGIDLANASLQLLLLAQSEIEKAKARCALPRAFHKTQTIDDLARQASTEQTIRAQPLPVKYVSDLFDTLLRNEMYSELEDFIDTARPVLVMIKNTNPNALAKGYGFIQPDASRNERDLAFMTLARMKAYEDEKIKASSIAIAESVWNTLRDSWCFLCGKDPRWLTRGQRVSLYSIDVTKRGNALVVVPDYPARFVADSGPPGWTPIVGKTRRGLPVRKSA